MNHERIDDFSDEDFEVQPSSQIVREAAAAGHEMVTLTRSTPGVERYTHRRVHLCARDVATLNRFVDGLLSAGAP